MLSRLLSREKEKAKRALAEDCGTHGKRMLQTRTLYKADIPRATAEAKAFSSEADGKRQIGARTRAMDGW